ncbi:putative mediator of RNA polymerase II transcription subunit 26 isoform X3 [Anguilla anguilla]|uniref:putative mediator of RNA polymerase II transcription subunit 26 isoform X3 n=1 Tax=Anguilla anguilla TaxID=7936 RepID=UPI0015AD1BCD|nr:putative mediator of RNA polymerase II transcription subunit 26 isoform X3 [Anguilla anguilla]
MAESESRNLTESVKTSGDIMTLPNKDIYTGTKRAGSRSASPERPHKSPRTTQSESCAPNPETREEQSENREGIQVEDAHQEGIHVKEAHQEGVRLAEALQDGMQLEGAHQEGVQVKEAHQEGVQVKEAHQEGMQLEGAHQEGVQVKEAHQEGVQVKEAHQEGVQVKEAHQEGMQLEGAHQEGVQVKEAHQEGVQVKEAHQEGVQVKEAHQEGMQLEGAHQEGVQVKEAHQEGVQVKEAHQEGMQLEGAHQEGVQVKEAHQEGMQVQEVYQDGMHQEGMQLEGAHQEGIQLEGAHQEGQMKEQESKGDGPALSPHSRRKSWRRSARMRRSFPALPSSTLALSRAISPSLPEEERLEKLMEASMQQALLKLQESLQSTPGASLDRLQEQVETVQREWCRLAQDIREQGQSGPSQTNTESDPGMQRTMDQIRKSIHRLQTECGLWDSLLLRHRSKADELARRVEQGRAEGVAVDASCLAQSTQSQFILSKPDYHSALLRQQTVLHNMELMMDTQCKMMRQLLSFQEQCHMLVKETSGRLASSAGFQILPSSPVRKLLAGSNGFKHDPLTSDTAGHALFP